MRNIVPMWPNNSKWDMNIQIMSLSIFHKKWKKGEQHYFQQLEWLSLIECHKRPCSNNLKDVKFRELTKSLTLKCSHPTNSFGRQSLVCDNWLITKKQHPLKDQRCQQQSSKESISGQTAPLGHPLRSALFKEQNSPPGGNEIIRWNHRIIEMKQERTVRRGAEMTR